jgi:hypothetical protein
VGRQLGYGGYLSLDILTYVCAIDNWADGSFIRRGLNRLRRLRGFRKLLFSFGWQGFCVILWRERIRFPLSMPMPNHLALRKRLKKRRKIQGITPG